MRMQFEDRENLQAIEPQDAIVEVINYAFGLSKTGGHPQVILKCRVEGHGVTFEEYLTSSPAGAWRIDTFLKSCGVDVKVGQNVEFDPEEFEAAKAEGAVCVELQGLRGWVSIIKEPGQKDPNKFYNKVGIWYTNKAKLPRKVYPKKALQSAQNPDEAAPF